MKLKSLMLIAVTAAPAWAVQVSGADLLTSVATTDGNSLAMLAAGLGLMATIARRRFK